MLCLATPWHYLARQQGPEASPIMQQANVLVWAAANTCCCSMWHPASWIWSERKVRLCHLVSWQHVGGYSFFPFESCSQNRSNTILGNSCHVAVCKGIFSFESIPHQAMAHKAKRMHGSLKCGWILTLLQWSSLTTLSVRKCCSGVCPHQASPRQPLQMHHGYSLVCRKIPMCPLAITACLFHVLRKLYDDSDSILTLDLCVYECMWTPVRLYDSFLSFCLHGIHSFSIILIQLPLISHCH